METVFDTTQGLAKCKEVHALEYHGHLTSACTQLSDDERSELVSEFLQGSLVDCGVQVLAVVVA